jgi:hypothetical protein
MQNMCYRVNEDVERKGLLGQVMIALHDIKSDIFFYFHIITSYNAKFKMFIYLQFKNDGAFMFLIYKCKNS